MSTVNMRDFIVRMAWKVIPMAHECPRCQRRVKGESPPKKCPSCGFPEEDGKTYTVRPEGGEA